MTSKMTNMVEVQVPFSYDAAPLRATRWRQQTEFGFPDGNCFNACIASLVDVEIESTPTVPATLDRHGRETAESVANWFRTWNEWLEKRNLGLVHFRAAAGNVWVPAGYWIASVPALNGHWSHAVVMAGRKLVHDPQQHRLTPQQYLTIRATAEDPTVDVGCSFLYVLDPAAPIIRMR